MIINAEGLIIGKLATVAAKHALIGEKVDVVKEDPDDNAIIECAIAGKADYIITGDNDLLELKEYKWIKIRNSQSFIQETNL